MKCINCGEQEATFHCDCLKVEHVAFDSIGGTHRTIQEQAVGIEPVGLCQKCQKKLIWKHRTTLTPLVVAGIFALLFVLGMIIFIAGTTNSANGGGSKPLQVIGTVMFVMSCVFFLVYDFIVAPARLRKTPYKVIGHIGVDAVTLLQEGKHDIYVPLGEGFYKNEKDFARINSRLTENIRKKIYEEVVEPGAWKLSNISSEAESKDVSHSGTALLEDSVNRLLMLYRQTPEGFLKEQAGEVRAVGQQLNEAGGMELMLLAHSMFAARNPRMARNLEVVWDGIGGWMG